jgi:hypothetical protein
MSNTPPVVNEQSSEAQKATSAATLLDRDETAARNFGEHVLDELVRNLADARRRHGLARDPLDTRSHNGRHRDNWC